MNGALQDQVQEFEFESWDIMVALTEIYRICLIQICISSNKFMSF